MSSWVAVASIGALKDQGCCRWNFAMKFLQQQYAKTNLRSYSQSAQKSLTSTVSPSSSTTVSKKLRQSEESLRTVMYLSSWAPN